MRKNLLLFISFLVIAAGLFVGGSAWVMQKTADDFDLANIQERGYINVLMPVNTPSYYLYKGRAVGYEYEMALLLAKQLKVRLKIKHVDNAQEAIDKLNRGEGDIIAMSMDITPSRKKQVSFTGPFFFRRQVLVRRQPSSRRLEISRHNKATNEKIERIQKAAPQIELPIPMVANGDIPYTVSDEHVAKLFAFIYPTLDVNHVVSAPKPVAWGVRKTSPDLLEAIIRWQKAIKKSGMGNYVYKKYFDMPIISSTRLVSHYSSLGGKRISPYDDLLKKIGQQYNFDWRFLASVVRRESMFNLEAESRAGALGLMQVVPETEDLEEGERLLKPEHNIKAGAKKLRQLDRYWRKSIADSVERIKFVLASYNVGLTHVKDAVTLAKKNDHELNWDNAISKFLLKKNESKYYADPDMKAGKCNCKSVVSYVDDIIHSFEEYERCM